LLWIGIEFGFAHRFDVIVAFAIGAGDVPDEGRVVVLGIGVKLALDGGESAEQEIAGIRECGSAAGRDAVLGEELEESGEEFVDVLGGSEFLFVGCEYI
jgi:hypothetical protein